MIRESSPMLPPRDESVDPMYANLILFLLELFWCVMVIVLIVSIHINPRTFTSVMEKACDGEHDDEHGLEEELKSRNHSYTVWACARLPLLIFLLVARGRSLFFWKACEHITAAWKRRWRFIKGIFELILYSMCVGSLFGILSPALQAWIVYADDY
jgi:hypothetical protein